MAWFWKRPDPLRPMVEAFVAEALPKAIEAIIPRMIEDALKDLFKRKPDAQLNEIGFNWALALSLRELWPDVSNVEAVRWLREYIEIPYGSKGFDWSASAAKTIAAEYVNEVGEVA